VSEFPLPPWSDRLLLLAPPIFTAGLCQSQVQLQELIESRGHLCDFYPKYHCELNFIEQYWGAAKLRFRSKRRAATINEMENIVLSCLDDIPLLQIRRFFFSLSHIASCPDVFLGLQIGRHVSFQHIAKGSQVRKLHGQTGGITATARCHRNLWPKCGSPS
jgi:hypothetical protein